MQRQNTSLGIKLTIIGDSGVGKSSLIKSLIRREFSFIRESTIGASFSTHLVNPPSESKDKPFKFEIWDTAGQERFSSLVPMYIRGSKCVLVVYDRGDELTFKRCVEYWIPFVKKELNISSESVDQNQIIVLIENKIDLPENSSLTRDALRYANENNMIFWKTSSCNREGIDELFEYLAKNVKKFADVSPKPILQSTSDQQISRNVSLTENISSKFKCSQC